MQRKKMAFIRLGVITGKIMKALGHKHHFQGSRAWKQLYIHENVQCFIVPE